MTELLKPLACFGALSILAGCGSEKSSEAESDASAEEAPAAEAEAAAAPETADERISYIIGYNAARQYSEDPVLELNADMLRQGMEDALEGKESGVDQAALQAASMELQQRMQEYQATAGAEAQSEGQEFLAENAAKEGVVTTDSGLQYEVLTEGESDESPAETDTVEVHYHGTLIDGTVFDSSVDRGQPASFALNGVIPGWTEGVQLMSVGDKYRFYVPSELAYGARGQGPIPPHSVLIFDVELLDVAE